MISQKFISSRILGVLKFPAMIVIFICFINFKCFFKNSDIIILSCVYNMSIKYKNDFIIMLYTYENNIRRYFE